MGLSELGSSSEERRSDRDLFFNKYMKNPQIEIKIKRITLNGEEELQSVSEQVQMLDKSIDGLRSMDALASPRADACIYCLSTHQLSSEHVIPFAWGGTLQIHRGSCEKCRGITQGFENFALNDGAMPHVRKALGMQSRSGHKSAKQSPAVKLSGTNGEELEVASDLATPLILGFPLFVRPGLLSDDGTRSDLRLEGMGAVIFGADVASFLEEHGARVATQAEDGKRAMPFARTIAKIAYGLAWRDGALDRLSGAEKLVDAFMEHPELIGAFLGTKIPPYERYQGCQARVEYKLAMPSQLVYMEVQLFADTGAPTYEVVLGRVSRVREWRNLRVSLRK